MHSVLARHQAGQIGRSSWRTNGFVGVRLAEACSFICEPIDIRRSDVSIATTSQGPIALIVSEDKDDIGRIEIGLDCRFARRQVCQKKKSTDPGFDPRRVQELSGSRKHDDTSGSCANQRFPSS